MLLGDLRNDGRGARARAPAHPAGDEDHVGAFEHLPQLLAALLGGLLADLGIRSGAKPLGELLADLYLVGSIRHAQSLGIRVQGDELDPSEPSADHPVYGVAAASAYTYHLNAGQVIDFNL